MESFNENTYTQDLFRILLDCMARPGKIGRIKPANCGLDFFSKYTLGIAITLLDQEVKFHIYRDRENFSAQIQGYTMSRQTTVEACDYFFVLGTENIEVNRLKKGTLTFPDESATVICQVAGLYGQALQRPGIIKLQLQGPGIKNRQELYVDGINKLVVGSWQEANCEFPLGLDWIFVDDAGQVCCIPRSTGFAWEVC